MIKSMWSNKATAKVVEMMNEEQWIDITFHSLDRYVDTASATKYLEQRLMESFGGAGVNHREIAESLIQMVGNAQ